MELKASTVECNESRTAPRCVGRVGCRGAARGNALWRNRTPGAQLVVVPDGTQRRQKRTLRGCVIRRPHDEGRGKGTVVGWARPANALCPEASKGCAARCFLRKAFLRPDTRSDRSTRS